VAPTPQEVAAAAWVAWHTGRETSSRFPQKEDRELMLWDQLRGRWMP